MSNRLIDLRSDTVTRPSVAMREAMASAEVGDDVYGEDPTVNAIETRVAAMFGHEAALFVPSGSMGNQVALQTLVSPGSELLCDADAHIVTYEIGAAAALGGISTRTWGPVGSAIDPSVVAAMVRPAGYHAVATRAIAVEQTHNRAGGAVIPLPTLTALRDVAAGAGLALHCDGARIWNAHIASGVPLATYGALFDTLSVCLSKGLGAPIGSVFVSSAERVAAGRVIRKRLGGGMRQAGVLAAAGLYALDHHIERLADDHARASRLAAALAPSGVVDAESVQTNIVLLDFANLAERSGGPSAKSTVDAASFARRAGEAGILVSVLGPHLGRLITHLDVTDADVDRAVEILPSLLS